jgi:hypothetical protein
MRNLATRLSAVTLLLCLAIPAFAANKYPPGPGGTCVDTLKITNIQDPAAACHPAVLDTVLGIGGIIIGFDAKPSAFAVYFQNSQGGQYTGVQAFTGATNYNSSPFSLAVGDSIVVYGTTQEFPTSGGTTEIEGPDVIQGTNDIIIRKVSSGNALPPFKILTTHEINWVPTSLGNLGEQYEECLVRVNGPLKVGRTSLQGGSPPLPFNSFLIVSAASPGDSVLIDGNLLTTLTPPAPGTAVDFVRGIVIQNTTTSVNSYRVTIRDLTDIQLSAPPNLTDGFPISDTITGPLAGPSSARIMPRVSGVSNERLRLVFDQNVDVTTAENEANYSLASGIDGSTVDLATVSGGNAVLLDITSVRGRGALETVTASGIGSQNCPSCLMSSQSRNFFNAVLTVKEVQAPDPDSLSGAALGCQDRSRFAGVGSTVGTRLSLRGVGVGKFGSLQYLEDSDSAPRSGVSVFGPSAPLDLGHRYLIAGQCQEFGSETEIANNVYLVDEATVGTPAAVVFTDKQVDTVRDSACDATQSILNGEDYEGMLIHINRLMVAEKRTAGQSFFAANVSGGTALDSILVSNLNNILGSYAVPDSGTIIDVSGILHFASGTFRICPRTTADITSPTLDVNDSGQSGKVSFSAYPNPARTTTISFSIPRRDNVELGVYDLLGRRVLLLARGPMPAGSYTKQWTGRDDSGNSVGPGVYFLHLRVGNDVYKLRSVKLN